MKINEPLPGATATVQVIVGESDLASTLPLAEGDEFPAVFATSRMIALMEIASARLLRPCLGAGELSVGVAVEVVHLAPTPRGALATALARYVGREGKQYVFEVVVSDEGGEVGRGRHKRAIIVRERLEAGAVRRNARE